MHTTPKETCDEDQTASMEAHDDEEEAASEARPQTPRTKARQRVARGRARGFGDD